MSNKRWKLGDGINQNNLRLLKILKDNCPAYAQHIFDENRVVEAFIMSDKGGIDPFDLPICKVCSKPGLNVEDPTFKDDSIEHVHCYCERHGITHDTKVLRQYLIEDMKINPTLLLEMELALYGY